VPICFATTYKFSSLVLLYAVITHVSKKNSVQGEVFCESIYLVGTTTTCNIWVVHVCKSDNCLFIICTKCSQF
jgi:hypothetical protein